MRDTSTSEWRTQMHEPIPMPGPIPIQDPPPDQGGMPPPEFPPDSDPLPMPISITS
jgi:hypothetical protein